jgi:predicted metal-dependent peptidase
MRESEVTGKIFVALDVSGSISEEKYKIYWSEILGMWDSVEPTAMQVVAFDTVIHESRVWEQGDFVEPIHMTGGGGTSMAPVWASIKEFDPEFAMIITDGFINEEAPPSGITENILWLVDENDEFEAPVGDMIYTGN